MKKKTYHYYMVLLLSPSFVSNMVATYNFAYLSLSIQLPWSNLHTPGAATIRYPSTPTNLSESVLFGTQQHSHTFKDVASVSVAGSVVPLANNVKLLSVTLDNRLSRE